MENTFNLFRLNCMMDDNKSKNYNSIIISLIFELIYEKGNKEVSRSQCYSHIAENLNIKIDMELFNSILEANQDFVITSGPSDVYLTLTNEKYKEIDSKVHNHSIEFYIETFLKKYQKEVALKEPLLDLLTQSIYENINSFTINNIKSILPQALKEKFKKEEIETFNLFLDENDHAKDIALFNVFLKAVEFAILTSGKGVKQFTKDIFQGKEYCLDSNIIFRLLGIGGEERKESLLKLVEACIHQGIKFKYCVDTYKEVIRKINSTIVEIEHGTKNKSLQVLEELIKSTGVEFNNGFIIHYAKLKLQGDVKTGAQYQLKLMADLRTLIEKYHIESVSTNFKNELITHWQEKLFEKKKDLNHNTHYTKSAAKVDAVNILLVKKLRGSNDYNYSDIVSFYLTTDRTLNVVMANENKEKIAETILPSQLFILHNALSDDEDERDYKSFNKFLKRRTTEFKHHGTAVLHYIDELRNITTNPESIRNIIKAYSDKKYETTLLSVDADPQFKSILEFAETFMDQQVKNYRDNSGKYELSLNKALDNLAPSLLSTKKYLRILDIIFTIILLPISVLLIKAYTNDLLYIILGTSFVEIIKFIISTKTNIYSFLAKKIFMWKVKTSNFYKAYSDQDTVLISKAKEMIVGDINIWK